MPKKGPFDIKDPDLASNIKFFYEKLKNKPNSIIEKLKLNTKSNLFHLFSQLQSRGALTEQKQNSLWWNVEPNIMRFSGIEIDNSGHILNTRSVDNNREAMLLLMS